MKVVDRHLLAQLVKYVLIAVASVVALYLLIDLFEELNYFTSRKVELGTILVHYFYSLPSAISLLYPVSMVLSVFMVYGQLTRHRELHALESAGMSLVRLFAPAVGLGLASIAIYLAANELVTIPFNARLSDLRRLKVEKRRSSDVQKRQNLYFVGEGGRVFYIRELSSDGVMKNFAVSELGPLRRVMRRFDVGEAVWRDGAWFGRRVDVRSFDELGNEALERHDTLRLDIMREAPADFASTSRPVEETPTRALRGFINRMKRAGENVAKEEVEYHYRFSYSLVGLIVVLLGLPVSVRLRGGGVMFGLGLGLLLSFLYWGAIQTSRAFGTSHVISPALAAWLPNIVFGSVALIAVLYAER
ncbi:YjgP/YjgQ family permease [candidate division WOR-3 bacterium]|nr:YjgP/YjgQ family permease [candidate division WOR-3 bacterium]